MEANVAKFLDDDSPADADLYYRLRAVHKGQRSDPSAVYGPMRWVRTTRIAVTFWTAQPSTMKLCSPAAYPFGDNWPIPDILTQSSSYEEVVRPYGSSRYNETSSQVSGLSAVVNQL